MSDVTVGTGFAVNVAASVQAATLASYNLTAATLVKAGAGRIIKFAVIVAGSAAGTINDSATTGGAAAANEIAVIPNTVGIYSLEWPTVNGLVVVPGTGQTVAVSYQ